MKEFLGPIDTLDSIATARWVSNRLQDEKVTIRNVSDAEQISVTSFPREITLLEVRNLRTTLGNATITFSFGSGASFGAIPGLSNLSLATTRANFTVSGQGQIITTTQEIRFDITSVTGGPLNILFLLIFRETASLT
ncbi:MAG: hypothetical protein ACK55I_24210 [bacterium]